MLSGPTALLLRHIRRLACAQPGVQVPDSVLLQRFITDHEEAAFEALVSRHGPMVLRVAHRMLPDWNDAEDIFQATFLILARRADCIRKCESVGSWLHGVAYRLALKLMLAATRRKRREAQAPVGTPPEPLATLTTRELMHLLDEGLQQLPEKYRAPLLLCYWEGRTHAEAARLLTCPLGTLRSRLERARQLLRAALVRRGVSLPATLVLATLAEAGAPPALPAVMRAATIRAGLRVAAGSDTAAAAGSVRVGQLVEELVRTIVLSKVKFSTTLVLAFSLVATGSILTAVAVRIPGPVQEVQPPVAQRADASKPVVPAAENSQPVRDKPARVDHNGDPLPDGAVARLGTARFADVGRPFALAFSPEGKVLAVGAWDGIITLWDFEQRRVIREWDGQAGSVRALAFSSDGATLAAAGRIPGIRLWRTADGGPVKSLVGYKGAVDRIAFSPDGTRLVSAAWSSLRLWDVASGQPDYSLDGYAPLSFAVVGSTLAIAGREDARQATEPKAYLLEVDLQSGRETKRRIVPAESGPERVVQYVNRLGLSTTGTWFGINAQAVWMTDVAGRGQRRFLRKDESVWVDYALTEIALTPDERCLVVLAVDQTLLLIELATGQVRNRFRRPERGRASVAFSPDGRWLACGSVDRTVLLWDLTGRFTDGALQLVGVSADRLARLWKELDDGDAGVANRAVWDLVAGARDAASYLGERLRPSGRVDPSRVASLIRDLESESFAERAKATQALRDLHDAAEPALRKQLTPAAALEIRRRLEQLLDDIDQWWGQQKRLVRAVEALEHMATPEAQRVLRDLSREEASPRLAEEAKRALQRLEPKRDRPGR